MRLAAVVPAAGRSRRMRAEKTLLPFGSSTVLESVLRELADFGVSETVAVLRPDIHAAAERARAAGARVAWNPDPEAEMLASIRLGLAALGPFDAVFVWPADHPAVKPETLSALAAAASPGVAAIPTWGGRRGHPALVGRELLAELPRIAPGEGLRRLWRNRADAVREVPVEDPGVLTDLDTPEDYAGARGVPES